MTPFCKKLIIFFFVCSLFPLAHGNAASFSGNLPERDAVATPVTMQQTFATNPVRAGSNITVTEDEESAADDNILNGYHLAVNNELPIPPDDQAIPPDSADDILNVYKLAIQNDPQFRGADNEQKALRESLSQAYARWMPEITGEVLYGRISQNIKESSNPVYAKGDSQYSSGTYTLKATQHLFNWTLFLDVSQAKNLRKRAGIDLESSKQDLILRVVQAYFTALASKESLAFAQAEKKDIEALHERATVKYQSGIAPVSDLYDARARLALSEAQVSKAENDYHDALQGLQEICNKKFTELKNLQDKLPMEMPVPDDAEHWVQMGLDRNLKLKIEQFNNKVAQIEVGRQRAGHYPSLDVVGRVYREDTSGSLFGGGSVVDTEDVMLQLSVPIFAGGLVRSKTKEAKARSLAADESVERQRRAVIRQVKAAYEGIKTSTRRAEALEKSIESLSNVLAAKQQGYRSGVNTSLAVLDASRDLYLSRRDYAQSRYDYVFNTLRLKQVMGILSDDDLVIINKWLR